MATKKAAPATKAGVKPGKELVKWDEALAARAAIQKKAVASISVGNFISLKAGQMSYQGNPVPGNKLDAVILSSILEHNLFEGEYDPNVAATPICFAFGNDEKDMKPHEKSAKPQHAQCGIAGQPGCCPHNEWGTAEKGKGKACKNVARLGLITADAVENPAAVQDAAVAYIKVPVTSVKGWAGFVNGCEANNKPTLAYVTEVSVAPDPKTQFKVSFHAKEEIKGPAIGALLTKADAVDKMIDFPYQPTAEAPAKRGGAKKAVPKKGAAKRKY